MPTYDLKRAYIDHIKSLDPAQRRQFGENLLAAIGSHISERRATGSETGGRGFVYRRPVLLLIVLFPDNKTQKNVPAPVAGTFPFQRFSRQLSGVVCFSTKYLSASTADLSSGTAS